MMTRLRTVPAALVLATAAVLLSTGVTGARPALADPPVNACANPDLATDEDGWEAVVGVGGRHRTAGSRWMFSVLNREQTTAAIGLPAFDVQPGQVWSVAVQARNPYDPARQRIEIDWLSAAGTLLDHVDGAFVSVGSGHALTRVSDVFTTPAGAAVADVVVRAVDLMTDSSAFEATGCTYLLN